MEQKRNRITTWLRESITARMGVVGFLLLILLIPLSFVQNLIEERGYRQENVVREINSKWGDEVLLSGAILKVPYKKISKVTFFNEKTNQNEQQINERITYAYFFPDDLNINSKVTTKPLNRSIYKSVVYTTDINVDGSFPKIDFSKESISEENILWDKITLLIQTSNLKGIRNSAVIKLENDELAMTPIYKPNTQNTLQLNSIESEPLKNAKAIIEKDTNFKFNLTVNGSQSLKFIPIGKNTNAKMESNWASPSFDGMFLPEDGSREISENGFKASWKVLQINRQFEQEFYGNLPDLREFAFGTNLIIPVSEYAKSERASKYGILVIGLTLLVFLLIQLVSKIYIHPFQYVMIGLALIMFYTLLISISEHSSFLKAYIIAAASVLALITLYSKTILNGYKFALMIGGSLLCLYGFIYVIIQLEDYALLVGSIGLFLILAFVMFFSKKIDWNNS
ncbi:cell envelope integrity protein CreD [Joostella sp.]|uniref:cell envelope integrity protein CreD n=1 Tax=Joostella sp. TaxID=2231138 RepID=UPI003A9408D8